jgi:hypothetical protein
MKIKQGECLNVKGLFKMLGFSIDAENIKLMVLR